MYIYIGIWKGLESHTTSNNNKEKFELLIDMYIHNDNNNGR